MNSNLPVTPAEDEEFRRRERRFTEDELAADMRMTMPSELVKRQLMERCDTAERERDEWKAQAEGEAIVAGSYRDERDAMAREARYHQQEIDRLVGRLRDTQSERDALAAQVDRQNKIIFDALTAIEDDDLNAVPFDEARDAYNETPNASLAQLRTIWQVETLENVKHIYRHSQNPSLFRIVDEELDRIRRQAGGDV